MINAIPKGITLATFLTQSKDSARTNMPTMWMIRGDRGRLYDDFRERNLAAIGWAQLAAMAKPGVSRAALIQAYKEVQPGIKDGTAVSGASRSSGSPTKLK